MEVYQGLVESWGSVIVFALSRALDLLWIGSTYPYASLGSLFSLTLDRRIERVGIASVSGCPPFWSETAELVQEQTISEARCRLTRDSLPPTPIAAIRGGKTGFIETCARSFQKMLFFLEPDRWYTAGDETENARIDVIRSFGGTKASGRPVRAPCTTSAEQRAGTL